MEEEIRGFQQFPPSPVLDDELQNKMKEMFASATDVPAMGECAALRSLLSAHSSDDLQLLVYNQAILFWASICHLQYIQDFIL